MEPPNTETADFSEYTKTLTPDAQTPTRSRVYAWILGSLVLLVTVLAVSMYSYWYISNQPVTTLNPTEVQIEPGTSVREISKLLAEAGIVRSDVTLFLTLRLLEDPTQIKASTYYFSEPQTTREIASMLIAGDFARGLKSLTFVEGMRAKDYAVTAAQLPNVTEAEFIDVTRDAEGTLFPETYFVPKDTTTNELVQLLQDTHNERIASYTNEIITNGLTMDEALILASIIEREANTEESMRTVAGIFLNRLEIGMALQADASIEYVIDTPLGELAPGQLASELRELDSPYNTYLYPGLPPTPIGNPGEVAIRAIAQPIESDYFYYITGNDGEFYYAETYDQHLNNIARHLR